ncbi:MAG: CvpA family protein [Rhodospirillales bacterium]
MDNLSGLPINAVDVAVALALLVSGVLAYARGFVHETLAVGGWVGAFFITIEGYPYLQPYARSIIPAELIADFAAGAFIFIVSLVILSLITRAISSRVKESALNVLDRSLGFLFGLVRGAVLVCVAYIGLEFMVPRDEQPEWITSARTLPLIVKGAAAIASLLPEDAQIEMPDVDAKSVEDIMDLVQPSTGKNKEEPEQNEGYSDETRQGIEQLIENSQ